MNTIISSTAEQAFLLKNIVGKYEYVHSYEHICNMLPYFNYITLQKIFLLLKDFHNFDWMIFNDTLLKALDNKNNNTKKIFILYMYKILPTCPEFSDFLKQVDCNEFFKNYNSSHFSLWKKYYEQGLVFEPQDLTFSDNLVASNVLVNNLIDIFCFKKNEEKIPYLISIIEKLKIKNPNFTKINIDNFIKNLGIIGYSENSITKVQEAFSFNSDNFTNYIKKEDLFVITIEKEKVLALVKKEGEKMTETDFAENTLFMYKSLLVAKNEGVEQLQCFQEGDLENDLLVKQQNAKNCLNIAIRNFSFLIKESTDKEFIWNLMQYFIQEVFLIQKVKKYEDIYAILEKYLLLNDFKGITITNNLRSSKGKL